MAAVIYRKAIEKGLIRGRNINAMIRAALYAACRDSGLPRTIKEISEGNPLFKKDIARCYRLILKELKMQMPVSDSVTCISKIAEKIGISEKSQGRAAKILHQAKEKKYGPGKDPMGLAAAALYIACLENNEQKKGRWGGPITQKDIAETAGVTEVTIRNRYKNLVKILDIKLLTRSEKIALFYFVPSSESSTR